MGFFNDYWINQLEVEAADLEARGVPADKAYNLANDRVRERHLASGGWVDIADWLRQQRKDEGLQ